ncbi:MAG: LPS export ABC transporter periplasmic protein LptC [Selenomonadaceae bacterium]|nr:LPS export ABC transporter periplasmic protein LptC [Selenomonadaceae bacterium]
MSTRGKIFAAIATIFFVCLVVWAVRTVPDAPPFQEKIEPPKVMEYEGNTIVEEKDGKIIWELSSDKIRVDSTTQDIELTGVKGKFYQYEQGEDGEEVKTWELIAKTGIYYQVDSKVYVEGDVDFSNSDGAKLKCDSLEWLSKDDKVYANGNVKISKEDMRAYGDMAYSDNGFEHFGLVGNAKVLKGVEDDEDI